MAETQRTGELLVHNRYITALQLDQAIELQRFSPGQPIGQILCRQGSLNPRDLAYVLDHYKKRRKLGEILVANRLVSEERLAHALKVSQAQKVPLGQTLIRQQLLDDEQLARTIAFQHDLNYVSLAGLSFDPALPRLVNLTFAKRLGIVPIGIRDRSLTIAMANPIQHEELSQLENWCKMPIITVIATPADIEMAQQKVFANGKQTDTAQPQLELSEDQEREAPKSKYLTEVISSDVDRLAKRILSAGIKAGTSDIHLEHAESGLSVRYRLDGILQNLDLGIPSDQLNASARQIVSRLKILCDMDIAERRRPQDSSFKMKVTREGQTRSVDFRVSTVPTPYGENVVIRILDKRSEVLTLEGLGYPAAVVGEIRKVLDRPTGIFLVTGPTGSGKSSTLYALLSMINSPGVKTLTIEDPIEYSIDGVTQTEVNEIIGNTFARMLRSFLRQDPDHIMVGEIRDAETAAIAMRAALTGHSVFSTLHTNDATSAVPRLLDMGMEPGLVSDTLRCVLAQRLVRRVCSTCATAYTPSGRVLEAFGLKSRLARELVHGAGCPGCNFTGYSGRVPVLEFWVPDRDELLLLGRRPDNLSLRKLAFGEGKRATMLDDGLHRVLAGETTLEELLRSVPAEQLDEGRSRIAAAVGAAGAHGGGWHRQVA